MKNPIVRKLNSLSLKQIRLLFRVFFFLFPLLCSIQGQAMAEGKVSAKYSPLKITEGVPVRPGTISWSPDGKRIAFIGRTLGIYDTETGEKKELAIKEPLYVSWATGDEILLIYREDERNLFCAVDAGSLRVEKLKLDMDVDAAFPASDGRRLFLVHAGIKHLSIGTDVRFTLFVFDRKEGTTKKMLTFGRTLPIKNPGEDYLKGWLHAGLNPIDDSLFIMEHIKPPHRAALFEDKRC